MMRMYRGRHQRTLLISILLSSFVRACVLELTVEVEFQTMLIIRQKWVRESTLANVAFVKPSFNRDSRNGIVKQRVLLL